MLRIDQMTILVTGGGGFLGRYIVRKLLAHGARVHVYGRAEHQDLMSLGAKCYRGDICDYDTLTEAFSGVDTVFHTAGLVGIWGARSEYFRVNSAGTANVIRGCIENKVSRLIFTSTPGVIYGKGHASICEGDESIPYPTRYDAPYPASKAVAEKMVLASNGWEMVVRKPQDEITPGDPVDTTIRRLSTCALRPHLLWGPGDRNIMPRLINRARHGKLRRIGDGRNLAHFCYVENAANAHLAAAMRLTPESELAGKAIFVADDDPVNLWQWIGDVLELSGLPPVKSAMSHQMARRIGAAMEVSHRLLPFLGEPLMTRLLADMLAGTHTFDLSRARRLLDYEPEVDMQTGLQNLAAWIKSELL